MTTSLSEIQQYTQTSLGMDQILHFVHQEIHYFPSAFQLIKQSENIKFELVADYADENYIILYF